MERYLEMQGTHHFLSTRPTSLYDCHMHYQIGQGCSVTEVCDKNSRRKSVKAPDLQRARRAKRVMPLMSHFVDNSQNWPDGVDLEGLIRILQCKLKDSPSPTDTGTDEKPTCEDTPKTDKPKEEITAENIPVAVEQLQTFRDAIEKEHEARIRLSPFS